MLNLDSKLYQGIKNVQPNIPKLPNSEYNIIASF